MKADRLFLFILLVVINSCYNESKSQVNMFDTPIKGTYQNTYKSPDWDNVIKILEMQKQKMQEGEEKQYFIEKNEQNWTQGITNFRNKKYREAIINLNQTIVDFPSNKEAYVYRGYSKYYVQDFLSAIEDFTYALSLDNTLTKLYCVRGLCYYDLGNYESAISDLTKSILNEQELTTSYLYRGISKSKLKDKLGAIRDYKAILTIDSTNTYAWNILAWEKYLDSDYKEALKFANLSLKYNPNYLNAIHTRAEIHLSLKDYNSCIKDATYGITIEPNNAMLRVTRAKAYFQQNFKTKACEDLSIAGELGDKDAYKIIAEKCQ